MKHKKWQWLPAHLITGDVAALAHVFQAYSKSRHLQEGKQLHSQLICSGFELSVYLANHLLNMYAKCGQLDYAVHLFDEMSQRNLVTWTALISAYSQNGMSLDCLKTLVDMRRHECNPTQFALSSAMQATSSVGWLWFGRQLHSLSTKSGFDSEMFVGSSLADMYSKCGSLDDACRVFRELPDKDEVSWTALIDGYIKNEKYVEAMEAFVEMSNEEIVVDSHVLCSVLGAYSGLRLPGCGKNLHSYVVKKGFELDTVVGNALIDMYCKGGDMESAARLFSIGNNSFNVISFSSLIDGYVEAEQTENALSLYVESLRQGIMPNEFTFSSLIKACANQAALESGTQFHARVIKAGSDKDPFISSGLVDMYGKCGLVESSIQMFESVRKPTAYVWNSILSVFAQHGLGRDAIRVFGGMVNSGTNPSEVTFISLLTACSHAGLVEEGKNYFCSMLEIYNIEPREEHYSCVIDLLSRAGRLREAEEFIKKMPYEPNAFGWCSLLAASRNYGDRERGEWAAKKLLNMEPGNSGAHILLSNVYAMTGLWEGVQSMRVAMRDSKVKKLPGFSWVDVGNKTHVFGAEDWSHPLKMEIYKKLDSLSCLIKEAGFIPNTNIVLGDMEVSLKERLLQHHSERIAIAFALMSLPAGKPIIVKKNIRVCLDCHSAIKYISKVVGRKIIVRDNTRFHHFTDGVCSCGDYW